MSEQAPSTIIGQQKSTELNRIHQARYGDALGCVFFELMRLRDPKVNKILNRYSVTLMAGYRVGIEYADGVPQILEEELLAEKERIAEIASKEDEDA